MSVVRLPHIVGLIPGERKIFEMIFNDVAYIARACALCDRQV